MEETNCAGIWARASFTVFSTVLITNGCVLMSRHTSSLEVKWCSGHLDSYYVIMVVFQNYFYGLMMSLNTDPAKVSICLYSIIDMA